MTTTDLQKQLHHELVEAAKEAKRIGYNPTLFNQMLANEGGYAVAKKLMMKTSSGFEKLWGLGRLDLSTEAIVLQPRFASLFTEEELASARDRLAAFGYAVPEAVSELLIEVAAQDIEANEAETSARTEGEVRYYFTKRYERDAYNRALAIQLHGTSCIACGFNFEDMYGEHGKDFIEVHHVQPLHTLTEAVEINAATDLVPLCSNCHQMVHRRKEAVLTVEELKGMIKRQHEK